MQPLVLWTPWLGRWGIVLILLLKYQGSILLGAWSPDRGLAVSGSSRQSIASLSLCDQSVLDITRRYDQNLCGM